MADVRSLAIRGIRSFGPEECDEQRITFEKPLTLILGQNGCGKTTIIESLRYAITGQMPPGSRNECFVHDAKVSRSSEVLGQVKLKIVNPKDKQLEVSRTMKVTSFANKKTRFQTLDSFLSVIDENGTTKDISSKCANLDNVMHEELGVSKAILNSVIFCHQEDSNWPLDEGKKVKDRFDEIFDADKYSVCFDRLRKLRKENTMTIKLLEQEVAFLTEKKQELDKRKLEVVNTEARISEAEIKIAELAAELKPVDEKIAAIVQLQRSLHDFETKKDKITTRLEHCRTQEEELKKTIKTQFEGTIEELQEQITNYSSTAKAKQKELEDSNRKIFYFNKEEEKIANERSNNEVKCSNLDLLESQNQEKIEKRKGMIAETAQIAELELAPIETVEDADKAFESVSEKIHVFKKELSDLKAQADAEEKEQQALVDACLVALSRHQQKISGKQGEIQAVTKQMAKLDKEINDVNESKVKLEAMEKKMEAAEEEYKQAGIDLNPEECQKEIDEDEKGRESLEQELEQLNDKITKLQKQATKLKEKEMIEESLKQKEKQFSVLKNKHKSAITELLGSMPEKDFTISVNKLECQIRNEVDAMKKKLKESRLEVTKLETERKYVRESLNERRSELTKAENKMYQACGAHPYETTLAKVSANLEKLQEEQSVLQSSMIVFAKYKRELKDNSCCPLCSRGFENENDVADLITQLTTEVINVPSKLEKVTEDLQRSSAKKDELLSMKTINEKITSLKETDIPKLETRLNDIDKQTSSLSEKVEELSMSLIEPEQKLQTAKQIQGDMPMLDRYTNEIKTAAKDLEAIQSQIGDVENDISLDDATAKQSDLRQKISTLRTRIKTAQKKLNAHKKKLQQVAEKKNKLKEQLLNLQRKVQEIVALQDKKKELEASIEKLKEEQKQLEDETAPLEADLKVKQDAKAEVIKKNRAAIDVKNTYIQKVISSFDKVKAVNNEIKQHKEKNIPLQKEKIKEANEKLNEKQRQLTDDRDALTKRINVLKDELAKQEIYKRDLEDNLKLRKAQNEIESGDKTLVELTESINGLNKESIAEKGPLIDQQTRLMKEKSTTQGELNMQKEYLKKSKNELKKYMTTDVEKNYKEKFYELHVTKAIDKDIRDYCVALEKCLMEFHKEKMENINLIIREMWRKIYRGNDIDYIEIKTEGGMTTESERRKYDYRVVQCKRDVEIDMRGRCSAGQKVLACLIIRLALAETFSSRFGVLALDEPTTNLDHENISSLCAALSEIVRERMRQKNFMFIIITHDKEFIESLGNIDKVTHYYEVSRNEDGKSRVKKIRFT